MVILLIFKRMPPPKRVGGRDYTLWASACPERQALALEPNTFNRSRKPRKKKTFESVRSGLSLMEAEGSRWETADIELMPRQCIEAVNKQVPRNKDVEEQKTCQWARKGSKTTGRSTTTSLCARRRNEMKAPEAKTIVFC